MRHSKYSRAHHAIVEQRAAGLRSSPTRSEQALWRLIRGKQLGVWFRRQVVLGRFIVDFAAIGARIVVEIDGGYHASRRAADARRDNALERLGYRVVRLQASLVLEHPMAAIANIREALVGSR